MTVAGDLHTFQQRLAGGAAAAVQRRRPQSWSEQDALQLRRPAITTALQKLYKVTVDGGLSPGTVDETIMKLQAALRGSRPTLIAVLFAPDTLLEQAPSLAGQPAPTITHHWLGLCWVAEAAWLAVDEGLSGDGYASGDDVMLRPLAARLRFLALSEPMRFRGAANAWLPNDGIPGSGANGLLERAFGTGSWHGLIGRCSQARRIWRDQLDVYQDHFFLAGATSEELEQDLNGLIFCTAERNSVPLKLSVEPLSKPVPLTPEDASVITQATERHLLPRFDLPAVRQLARHDSTRRRERLRTGLTWGIRLTAALAVTALTWSVYLAAGLACTAYGLIVAGAVAFGEQWASPWLLRLPATSAVGLLVLITLPEDWWQQREPSWNPAHWLEPGRLLWPVPLLLLAAAYGYLVIECRNHGLTGGASLGRALRVTGLGLIHATLVAAAGVVTLLPAFAARGDIFARLWTGSAWHPHQAWILAFTATWCLVVGVFSQILWEDRPITAPLAHLSWRSGR